MLLLVGSQRIKSSVMVYQKQCPRLAQGPDLVSSVAFPWLADLVSPDKPDSALHPQSLQGRDRSSDTSPKNTACANSPQFVPAPWPCPAWKDQLLSKAVLIHPSEQAKDLPPEVSSAEGRLDF